MHDALSDLRRTRRTRRLGDVEWFDLAYRVYIAAIFGGSAVIILSDQVGDDEATPAQIVSVFTDGPAVLGMVAVLAVALGLRSGSDGGPLSIEAADVRHLLLAPVERRTVLTRPLVQRLRSAAFASAIVGGIGGVLAAQRLPGSAAAWTASGAVFGTVVGLVFVAVATITHALRVSRPIATSIAAVLVVWQLAAIVGDIPGPGDRFGDLALWGYEQQSGDLIAVAVTLALAVIAWRLVGRLRVEPLARRGDLVSQLRFAVTMQDLRTVVLLRRQLRNERPRRTPWLGLRPSGGSPRGAIWRRSWRGIARTPAGRLARMAALAGGAGLAAVAVIRGTTPAFVAMGVLLFLIGLEAVEPLSQEIDQPGLTDGLPIERGLVARPPAGRLGEPARTVRGARCRRRRRDRARRCGGSVRARAPDRAARNGRGRREHRARRSRPGRRRVGVRAARVRRVQQRDAGVRARSRSARSVRSRCWPRVSRPGCGDDRPLASSGSSSS